MVCGRVTVLALFCWASLVSAGSVNLMWDAVPTGTHYRLHYGMAPGHYQTVLETGSITGASVGGLYESTEYFFAATALNAGGESPYSNEVRVMLAAPLPVDTLPPTVAIVIPAYGAIIERKSPVMVGADASDDVGVVRVEMYITDHQTDRITLLCTDNTMPYWCEWDVPAPPRRAYGLQAKAYDAAGHMGISTMVEVTSE